MKRTVQMWLAASIACLSATQAVVAHNIVISALAVVNAVACVMIIYFCSKEDV